MAENISTLLQHALGKKDSSAPKDEFAALPNSLKKLTDAISKASSDRANLSKKELDAASRRQEAINALNRQYQADLKETARILKELNATESGALRAAEKESKMAEAYRKREDDAARRASRLSEVGTRQAGETRANWLGLVGALGGEGIRNILGNFIKAEEQTKADIAKVSEARYEERLATAAAEKENKIAGADRALEDARLEYANAMTKATEREGKAILTLAEGDKALTAEEQAGAAYEAAKAERDRAEREGLSRLQAAREGASDIAPLVSPIGDIASAIREGTEKRSGLILDAETQAAVEKKNISRIEAEVAERNLAAEAKVSAAGSAYAEARKGGIQGALTYAAGAGEVAAAGLEKEAAASKLAAAGQIADETKAAAVREETEAAGQAFLQKKEGSLVSSAERSVIGSANLMSMAVAPPAVVIIGKVMEKFKDLFPIIEQTGGALVEMATALPAANMVIGNELASKIILMGSNIADTLRITDNKLRARYEASGARVATETGRTRAQWYTEYQEARVAEEKAKATGKIELAGSEERLAMAGQLASPVKANAPMEFSVETIPSAASGITHTAPERKAVAPQPPPAYRTEPYRAPEQTMGVVPVGASNRSVDEWR